MPYHGTLEQQRAYMKTYRKNRGREKDAEWRLRVKLEVFEKYGGKCRHCGFTDARALCIDHVNGGGEKERKETGGRIYAKLRRLPRQKEYQLLCANCNMIKSFAKGELNGGKHWKERYRRYVALARKTLCSSSGGIKEIIRT